MLTEIIAFLDNNNYASALYVVFMGTAAQWVIWTLF
jgi:hypothetical protein